MKKILVINGSASSNSSNEKLIHYITGQLADDYEFTIYNGLKTLPHFDPGLADNNTPAEVTGFRHKVDAADGILICTPEYVFSIPSGLKNAIEWSVSTTIFSGKPTGLITASADGEKGHEELQLIMKTVSAIFVPGTTLLIRGIKSKVNQYGEITDHTTKQDLAKFTEAFQRLTESTFK